MISQQYMVFAHSSLFPKFLMSSLAELNIVYFFHLTFSMSYIEKKEKKKLVFSQAKIKFLTICQLVCVVNDYPVSNMFLIIKLSRANLNAQTYFSC